MSLDVYHLRSVIVRLGVLGRVPPAEWVLAVRYTRSMLLSRQMVSVPFLDLHQGLLLPLGSFAAVVCSMVPYRTPLGWCVLLRSAPVIESRLEYAAVRPVAIPVVFLPLAGPPFGGDLIWRWSVKRPFEQLSWVGADVLAQPRALKG